MKFYKHDPNAWLAGTVQLSLEQRGAYITIIDLLYCNDDVLIDDDQAIARTMNCQVRRWQRLKAELMAMGKIRVDTAGLLHANRVTETVKTAAEFSFQQQTRVRKRWIDYRKAKENNDPLIRARNTSNTHSYNTELLSHSEKAKPLAVDNEENSIGAETNTTISSSGTAQLKASLKAKGWI
jgi:uncharacterized protein YdaU (DUF1376 family)